LDKGLSNSITLFEKITGEVVKKEGRKEGRKEGTGLHPII